MFSRKKDDNSRIALQEDEPTHIEEIKYLPSLRHKRYDHHEETESDDIILLDNLGKPRNPPNISEIEEELKPENRSQSQVSFPWEEGGREVTAFSSLSPRR